MTSPSTPEGVSRFEKFLDETLRPDLLRTTQEQQEILAEIHEYEVLLVTIQKMMEVKSEQIKTRVNIGRHIFVNAEIDETDKMIVKMMGDLFVELPLPRAAVFVEARIKLLMERCEACGKVISKIRAHMDLVLSSLEEYYKDKANQSQQRSMK